MHFGLLLAYVLLLTIPPLAIAAVAGALTGLAIAYLRMFVETRALRRG